jgi:hypothetical protein
MLHLAWSCGPTGACGFNQEGASYSDGGEFGYPGGCPAGACLGNAVPATAFIGILLTSNHLLPTNILINPASYTWFPWLGEQGEEGPMGPVGNKGIPGEHGASFYGSKGSIGDKGIEGSKGAAGAKGSIGDKGSEGDPTYLHIKYADYPNGANCDEDSTRPFIGVYTDNNVYDSSTCGDYAWTQMTGSQGVPGPNGATGPASFIHIAWNLVGDCNAGGSFTTSGFPSANWMGTFVDFTQADSTTCTDYDWVEVEGPAGETTYFHIKYADSIIPSGTNCDEDSTRPYIGTYTDQISPDSSTCGDYAWSQWTGNSGSSGVPGEKGDQGATQYGGPTGSQGVTGDQGEIGATGLEIIVSFKYSNNENGYGCETSPYSAGNTGYPHPYIGVLSGLESGVSGEIAGATCTDYTWSRYQGPVGAKGNIGPKGGDGTQGPIGEKGILGTKGTLGGKGNIGDKGHGEKGSVGNKGYAGDKGQKGIGEKGGDGTQGPIGEKGILGTKGAAGAKGSIGDKGSEGIQGDAGVTSYIHINYSNNSDGSVCNQPSGDYIGILIDNTVADSNNCGEYDWSQFAGDAGPTGTGGSKGEKGKKGQKGVKGTPSVDGQKGEQGPQGPTFYGGPVGEKGESGSKGGSGPSDIVAINQYCPASDPHCSFTISGDSAYSGMIHEDMWCGGVTGGDGRSVISAYLSEVFLVGSHTHSGGMGCAAKIVGDGSTGAATCWLDQSYGDPNFKCVCGIICQ